METTESPAGAASFVGIEVSKAAPGVALRPAQQAWRSPNEAAGIAEVVGQLRALSPHLVVLEATGGLERLVVAALALAALPVVVVTPRQVRDARPRHGPVGQDRCLGRGGDARTLPRPCAPPPTPHAPCPPRNSRRWRRSPGRRQHLVGMLSAEKQRLQQALPAVRATVAAHSAWREQALRDLEGELDQTLQASPLWR